MVELAQLLTSTDLRSLESSVPRSQPTVGVKENASRVRLSPFETMLITGSSGAGKSTVVTALLEQIHDLGFQFCVVDPEGDYSEFPDAVVVGDARQEPRISELTRLLTKPEVSVVANLLAIDPAERPRFFAKFLPEIAKLRSETGRPHWIVLDEAHHCLPAKWHPAPITLPTELPAAIAVTVHPDEVAREFLDLVSTVIGVGDGAIAAIEKFSPLRRSKWIRRFGPEPEVPSDVAYLAGIILLFDWRATILSSRLAHDAWPARAVTVKDGRRPSRSGAKRPLRSRARWHSDAYWDEQDGHGRQYGSGFGAGDEAAVAAGRPAA